MLSITIPAARPVPPAALFDPEAPVPLANILSVSPEGHLKWRGKTYRCALGRAGIAMTKREGDGATPVGCFNLRRVLYRPEREDAPQTLLAVEAIYEVDGWCDDPEDPEYNRPVSLPHGASAEAMWREDSLYDIVVVLGHNDAPVIPGCGSAIFLHVATPAYAPTEGCIALAREDLLKIIQDCDSETQVCVLD
jgi:L,D-peptidoglycan transpeptidase YkuD (ErfK/YbiS/YcfS/YnhG family)